MPRAPRPGPVRENSDSERTLAVMHEVANLLAAARMTGHFLAEDLSAPERLGMSRDIERLMSQSAALLGQLRPLLDPPERTSQLTIASLLNALTSSLAGTTDSGRLKIAKARGLPEVRVHADAFQHVLVALVTSAIGESKPSSTVRVTARVEGRRAIVAVADDAPRLDLGGAESNQRGRELGFELADAVLRRMGGRAVLAPRRRGNQIELVLRVGRRGNAEGKVTRPRAGRGAPRRP